MTQQLLATLTEKEKEYLKQLDFTIRQGHNLIDVLNAKAEVLALVQKVKART